MNRVFFLHPRWQIGGVETTNERWASILTALRMTPIALTYGSHTNQISNMNLINLNSFCSLLLFMVTKLTRNDTLLVCQSYYMPKLVPLLIYLKLRGVRLVITERNSFDQFNDFPIKRKFLRYLLPVLFLLFDKIIVNSQEMSSEAIYRLAYSRLLVIRNPRFSSIDLAALNLRKFMFASEDIYTFCRWAPQKDPEFMVKIARFCQRKNLNFSVFCNQNTYNFQKQFVSSAFDYMKEHPGILFFASKFEGYPNLLIEARALGLPIIFAICNTGVKEILKGYDRAYEFQKSDLDSFEEAVGLAKVAARSDVCRSDLDFANKHSEEAVEIEVFKSAFY